MSVIVRTQLTSGTIGSAQTICYNTAPSLLTGSVATGGAGTYTYQWESSTDGTTWSAISGATSQDYQPGVLTVTTQYRRQVTDLSCGTVYSNNIIISVRPTFAIGTISSAQTICYNTTPTVIAGSIATGGSGNYTYQWENSTNGTTWNTIVNATSHNYQPGALTVTTQYRRKTTDTSCSSEYTNTITINVRPAVSAGVISSDQTVCYNTAPSVLTGSVATGGSGNYTYQWESSTNGTSWNTIAGATSQNYQPSALGLTTLFRRKTSDITCETQYTNSITISVLSAVSAGVIGNDQTICYNTSPTLLTGGVAMGGSGNYTYQWESSTDGATWANVIGATSQNYQPGALTAATQYRRKTIDQSCGNALSNIVLIDVRDQFTAGTASSASITCYGQTPPSIDCSAPTGGSGNYTYQWESGNIPSSMTDIIGATAQSYQPGTLTTTTYYRRKVTDQYCGTISSNTATRTVWSILSAGVIGSDQTICYNTAPSLLTGGIASGGSGTYTYQWESSTNGTSWNTIVGATSQNYQSGTMTANTYYRRKTSDATCGTATSNMVLVTVRASLNAGTLTGTQTICSGTTPSVIAGSVATGGSGSYSYQWESSTDGVTWSAITGATSQNYQPGILNTAIYYRRKTTDQTCETGYSTSVKVSVQGSLNAGTLTNAQTICYNTTPTVIAGSIATGGSGTYTYQWEKSTDGTTWNTIVNATSENYQPGVLTSSTIFRRKVSDLSCGSGYANTITIGVRLPVSTGTVSSDQTVCYNTAPSSLTGGVATGGSGSYTYQWQSSTNGTSWSTIAGAVSQNYQPGTLTTNTYYRRIVTDAQCEQATSNIVLVTIRTSLTAGTLTGAQTICSGATPTAIAGSVATGGSGTYSYQWESSTDGVSWSAISGATSQNYQHGALTATTHYRRKTTDQSCGSVYSNAVIISVQGSLNAGTLTNTQTICPGATPTIIAGSTATGGSGTYTYQWESSTDGTTWLTLVGAASINYQPGALTATTLYRRKITDLSCGSGYTNTITISVRSAVSAGVIGSDQTVCYNTAPSSLTGGVATGGSGTYTYQWESSANGTSWNSIVGATSQNYQPGTLTVTTYYRRKTIDLSCGEAISNIITITTKTNLVGGTLTDAQTICPGATPTAITGSVATGGSGTYSYQWESSADGVTWSTIQGVTSQNYQPGALTVTTQYRRKTIDQSCGIAYSNILFVTIRSAVSAGVIGSDQTVCYNTAPSSLTGGVATGGSGSYTYQWENSTNGTSWNTIASATSQNYQPGTLTVTTHYRRKSIDTSCGQAISNTVTVSVKANVTSGVIGSDQTVCYNTAPSSLTGGVATGGSGSYSYQWESSTNGTTWNAIVGATTQSYQPGSLTVNTYYRRKTIDLSCGEAISNIITVTIRPNLVGGTLTDAQTICPGATPTAITGSVATGGSGTYTYQWESSIDGVSWSAILGATSQNYQPGALTATTQYRRKATDQSCGIAYSNILFVTIRSAVSAGVIGSDQTVCYNTAPSSLAGSVATGGSGTYTYQWESSTNGTSWNTIASATSQNYQPGTLTITTYYRRKSIDTSCGQAISNTVTVNVKANVTPGVIGSDQTVCYNTASSVLTGTIATGGWGTFTYQWESSTDGSSWAAISGATSQNYQPSALTATTQYRRADSDICTSKATNKVTVTVRSQVNPGTIGNSTQNACYNGKSEIMTSQTAATGGTGTYTYLWQYSVDGSTWTDINGATLENYQSGNLIANTSFRRNVINECGTAVSNVATVTLYDALKPGTIGISETVVYNTVPSVISVSEAPSGGDGIYTYQWQQSIDASTWTNIPSATSESYQPGALTQTMYYKRITKSACGNIASNVVTKSLYAIMTGGTIGDNQTKCYNTNVAPLTTKTTPTGGSGSYTYEWESSADGVTWAPIVGYTTENYQPTAAIAKKYYRRKVTAQVGGFAYSNVVIIDVYAPVVGAVIGDDQEICNSSTPEPLKIITNPSGGNGIYTYQWQQSQNGTSWTTITGATGIYLELAPLSSKMYFRLNTMNTCNIMPSNAVTIKVSDMFNPGSIGSDQTILYNTAPQKINVAISPSGGSGTYTYQWQQSLNGTTWLNIAGAVSDNYQPGVLTQKTYYKRLTTNVLCGTISTNSVAISITTDLAVGTIGNAQTICYGSTPTMLSTLTAPSSQAGVYYIQWQQSVDGITWVNIPGATSSDYSPSALYQTTYYRKIVSTGSIGDVATNIIKITVGSTFNAGTIKDNQNVCANSVASAITFDLSPSGSDGNYTYQWQTSTNNAEWSDIANAKNAYYTPSVNGKITFYRSVVNSNCGSSPTNSVSVTVNDALVAGNIGESQNISYNSVPAKLIGDLPTGGSGVYSYQWQYSNDGTTWSNIIGATSDSYQPGALTRSTSIRRITLSIGCDNAVSNIIDISVYPNLTAGSIGSAQTVCYNGIPNKLEGTLASGGNGIYAYQWESCTDGKTWVEAFGKTTQGYQPGRITQATQFRRKVTSGTDVKYSNTVLIDHLEPVVNPTLAPKPFYCKNSNVQLSLATDYSVVWYNADMGELSTGKSVSFVATVPTSIYYSVKNEIGCLSVPQQVAINVDYADSHIQTNAVDNNSIENGKRITFTPQIESNHSSDKLTYQWEFSHKEKGLYVTMFDAAPSQYFHWAGWHDVTLKLQTPNGCQFVEKVENLFSVMQEAPTSDKSGSFEIEKNFGEKNIELKVDIYPIPVRDDLHFKFNKNVTMLIEIMSASGGSLIKSPVMDSDFYSVPVSSLPSGIYFIRIYDTEGNIFYQDKIIKKK